jgi:hypothetical protein
MRQLLYIANSGKVWIIPGIADFMGGETFPRMGTPERSTVALLLSLVELRSVLATAVVEVVSPRTGTVSRVENAGAPQPGVSPNLWLSKALLLQRRAGRGRPPARAKCKDCYARKPGVPAFRRRYCSMHITLGDRNHRGSPGFRLVVMQGGSSSSGTVHSLRQSSFSVRGLVLSTVGVQESRFQVRMHIRTEARKRE